MLDDAPGDKAVPDLGQKLLDVEMLAFDLLQLSTIFFIVVSFSCNQNYVKS